jgi:hypothetical protein
MVSQREKQNQIELRIFAMRRSGHHAIISWIIGHFRGEVYRDNNVSMGSEFVADSGSRDEEFYNASSFPERECHIFNVEDCDLSQVMGKINSDEWHTYAGPSNRIQGVLILRDPYNIIASRMKLFGDDPQRKPEILGQWKQHAKEFLGQTRHLPKDTVMISYNSWFASKEYRRLISEKLGLVFSDLRKNEMMVGSSFEGSQNPQSMDVFGRWRHYISDAGFRKLFLADPVANELAEEIFGDPARVIFGEITKADA